MDDALKKAQEKYNENIKGFLFRLNKEEDKDIIEFLSGLESANQFIKDAVKKAIVEKKQNDSPKKSKRHIYANVKKL